MISVIMGVYNCEKYLRDSIDSVLGQTYSNFEFIIINDGSTDESEDIIREYMNIDSRIILLNNKRNMGLTASLNRGLKTAKGKYIARMDADDICHPERLARQYSYLEENLEVIVLGTAAYNINEDNQVIGERSVPLTHQEIIKTIHLVNPLIHPTVMFRKEEVEGIGNYNEEFASVQDYELWFRVMANNYQMANLAEKLLYYRLNEGYYTRKSFKYRMIDLKVRWQGYKQNNLAIIKRYGIFIPVILGLIPASILSKIYSLIKIIDPRNSFKDRREKRLFITRRQNIFKFLRILGDILLVNLSFLIAFYLRYLANIPEKNFAAYLELMPYISLISVIVLQMYNMYSKSLNHSLTDIIYTLIPVSILIVISTIVISYFNYNFAFPRSVLLFVQPIILLLMMAWRYAIYILENIMTAKRNTVIIGSAAQIEKTLQNIKQSTSGGFNILAVIVKEENISLNIDSIFSTKVYNGLSNIDLLLDKLDPDLVFITAGLTEEEKKNIVYLSLEKNWELILVPGFYEIMLSGARLEHVGELPVFELSTDHGYDSKVKRVFDIISSSIGLILTFPIMLVVAFAVKINSPGPIFYKQLRVSKNGKLFNVYKFRTMIENAELSSGPILSSGEGDNRVTQVGRFLRKTRIDEIPQLINIFKGDMGFIGPRPERPHFVEKYEQNIPDYKYRHQLKSGLTGLAQVQGYYSTDPQDKLRMDLLYANKKSLVFDIKILLQTIKVIFIKKKSS